LAAPCRAVCAHRKESTLEGLPHRLRHLAAGHGGGSPLGATILLRTPRYRASGHVLLFAFAEGADEPAFIAKVARLPGPSASLSREAAALQALAEVSGGVDGVPRCIEKTSAGASAAIIESAVPGIPVHPARVRRDLQAHLAPFLCWLIELQSRTRVHAAADEWWEESVEKPLGRIETLFGASGAGNLAARTRQLAAPLRERSNAWVFEHGDFSAPNLLLHQGRPGIVDWEMGKAQGALAADLFCLLGFVARAREGAVTTDEERAALRGAFFGSSPWAAESVRSYASSLGIRHSEIAPLYVLSWARSVAGYIERLEADAAAGIPCDAIREWLATSYPFAAWEDAVNGYADLRPAGEGNGSES
jgi:hypothetical protein